MSGRWTTSTSSEKALAPIFSLLLNVAPCTLVTPSYSRLRLCLHKRNEREIVRPLIATRTRESSLARPRQLPLADRPIEACRPSRHARQPPQHRVYLASDALRPLFCYLPLPPFARRNSLRKGLNGSSSDASDQYTRLSTLRYLFQASPSTTRTSSSPPLSIAKMASTSQSPDVFTNIKLEGEQKQSLAGPVRKTQRAPVSFVPFLFSLLSPSTLTLLILQVRSMCKTQGQV